MSLVDSHLEQELHQGWFSVQEVESNVYAIGEPLHHEDVRSFLVIGDRQAALIDTGMGVGNIRAIVDSLTDLPIIVLNSHAHWDHIGGNHRFDQILIHQSEADRLPLGYPKVRMKPWFESKYLLGPLPEGQHLDSLEIQPSRATGFLEDGDVIDLGGRSLEVIHLPGHSSGSLAFLDRDHGLLFSTDVLYAGPLYSFMGMDGLRVYASAMKRMAEFAPFVRLIYPSHNPMPMRAESLAAAAAAFQAIADGREPDDVSDGVPIHRFDQFAVEVRD